MNNSIALPLSEVFCYAGLLQVMLHHTDILTGGRFSASTPSLKTHAAVIETENRTWQELDTRESVCGKRPSLALLRSRQARERTLPVTRCWLLITRWMFPLRWPRTIGGNHLLPRCDGKATRATAQRAAPLWSGGSRFQQSTLVRHFVRIKFNWSNYLLSFLLKWRPEPSTKWLSTHLLMVENAE